jgi:hypothetical protein
MIETLGYVKGDLAIDVSVDPPRSNRVHQSLQPGHRG